MAKSEKTAVSAREMAAKTLQKLHLGGGYSNILIDNALSGAYKNAPAAEKALYNRLPLVTDFTGGTGCGAGTGSCEDGDCAAQ